MALQAPANFNEARERKYMSEDNSAIEDYKRNCEFHRLLRRYCGPNAYSVLTALQDRANDELNDGWAFPSYEKIMEDTGIGNRNAITTALELLFELGLIEWQLNGRKAIYKPVKKVNSTELILFIDRAQSYQNDTKDSIKTVPSIVSKRYSNVYQYNVNQNNDKTTPNGVAASPQKSSTIELIDSGPFQEKQPEPEAKTHAPYPAPQPLKAKPDVKARDKPAATPLHPALKVYQDTFKLLPQKRQFQAIIDRIGNAPEVLTEWGKACGQWNLKSWKPGNIGGLLNYFEEGNYKNDQSYTGGTDRGRSERATGKNRTNSAFTGSKPNSDFEPGFWDKPDAVERAKAAWTLS